MRRLLLAIFLLFQLCSRAQQIDTAYEFPAQTRVKGIVWTTAPQKGGLSCLIENTDTTIPRNLYVFYQRPDSILMIHIKLDSSHPYKFAFFNLYPGDKRLYLTEDSTFLASQFITDTGQGNPMAAAIVTHRIDKRGEMDHRYASGVFAEPTLFSFETFGEPYSDLGSFLRAKTGRLQGGYSPSDTPKDVMGHRVFFYLNEQNMPWPIISSFDFRTIAYVKVFESDFLVDDFDKINNGMSLGFSWDTTVKSKGGLKLPDTKSPLIVAMYTYKDPHYVDPFKKKRKKRKPAI